MAMMKQPFSEQSAVALANQLYCHPEVQGQHPRRHVASDYLYSLGLLLLEIALWIPLVERECSGRTTSNYAQLDMARIKAAVSSLPSRGGTIYKEVAETCLDFGGETHQVMSDQWAEGWNAERLRNQNWFSGT